MGSATPDYIFEVIDTNSTADGSDGVLIAVNNSDGTNGTFSGIAFKTTTSANTKGAILYQKTGTWGRGDLIFANNAGANSNVVNVNSARMIITNDGIVQINNDSLTERFNVTDDVNGFVAMFLNDGDNTNRYGIKIQAGKDDASATNNLMVGCYDGDGDFEGGLVINNGNVEVYSVSDKRLKSNIINTKIDALHIINNLRVVDFNYKQNNVKQTGYIAQEAKEVFPDMVGYNEQEDIYTIATSRLIPILNKAIQQQQKQISDLEKQLIIQQLTIEQLKLENIEQTKAIQEIELIKNQLNELQKLATRIN